MFSHILVPTDGSEASKNAIQDCIAFAKEIGAKITGFHVVPEYRVFTYQPEMLEDTRDEFEKSSAQHAKVILAEIETAAKAAGVNCETFFVTGDDPYEEIIKVAKDKGCDLIAMASHGRKGVKGLLMGSETQKVLTHSHIPVLVLR